MLPIKLPIFPQCNSQFSLFLPLSGITSVNGDLAGQLSLSGPFLLTQFQQHFSILNSHVSLLIFLRFSDFHTASIVFLYVGISINLSLAIFIHISWLKYAVITCKFDTRPGRIAKCCANVCSALKKALKTHDKF